MGMADGKQQYVTGVSITEEVNHTCYGVAPCLRELVKAGLVEGQARTSDRK